MPEIICKVDNCGRTHSANGFCVYHAQRARAHGNPVGGGMRNRKPLPERLCSIEGCSRTHFSNNLCANHHQRWYQDRRRAARPTKITQKIERVIKTPAGDKSVVVSIGSVRRKSDGWLNRDGYRLIPVPPHTSGAIYKKKSDQWIMLEHRFVIQGIIGRPLLQRETIHHINGRRSDNRPENLELWAHAHGPGQRVEDMLSWANEIIALYGHLSPATFGRIKK